MLRYVGECQQKWPGATRCTQPQLVVHLVMDRSISLISRNVVSLVPHFAIFLHMKLHHFAFSFFFSVTKCSSDQDGKA